MTADESQPKKRTIELGPTGENVKQRITDLRGGLQYKQLAERLEAIGRPIPALGLRRIEQGTRRVDVDDLVALAIALEVSPLTLLLPENASCLLASEVTGVEGTVAHNVQWLWGRGDEPLELANAPHTVEGQQEIERYRLEAGPGVIDKRGSAVGGGWSDDQMADALAASLAAQRIGQSNGNR